MLTQKKTPFESVDASSEGIQEVVHEMVTGILDKKNEKDTRARMPYIVGIDGPPAAGKSTIIRPLVEELTKKGKKVVVINADHFLHYKIHRYPKPGEDPADVYERRTLNRGLLRMKVLEALTTEGRLQQTMNVLNLLNEDKPNKVTYDIDPDTIVIIEGIFMFHESLRGYLDTKIFLDVERDLLIKRGLARNAGQGRDKVEVSGEEYFHKILTRFEPGYGRYKEKHDPMGNADYVVESRFTGYKLKKRIDTDVT